MHESLLTFIISDLEILKLFLKIEYVSDSGNSVNCGDHQANTCSECPQGNGAGWCNGDCVWESGSCVAASENSVSCGGHQANTCAECPQGNGAGWCNGDCVWESGSCVATGKFFFIGICSHTIIFNLEILNSFCNVIRK